MSEISRLIDGQNPWLPTRIDSYRNSFTINTNFPNGVNNYQVKSNFAYNFQYLEYMLLQFDELKLTSALEKILCKTFIITGMSIVELSFYSILATKNKLPVKEWTEYNKFSASKKTDDLGNVQVRTTIFIENKNDNIKEQAPKLDTMIKRIQKLKIKELALTSDDFAVLRHLQKLRNLVHLQGGQDVDTDYNSFKPSDDIVQMKKILFKLFGQKGSLLTNDTELFSYLNPEK